ncbi:MAG: hypothetical protein BGO25_09300 [Acidobacteriales bacterium 59-55]|nr:MAG: hypothetical protein BGO25_09300 [Acidobacteriales bacterium 59-55]
MVSGSALYEPSARTGGLDRRSINIAQFAQIRHAWVMCKFFKLSIETPMVSGSALYEPSA